MKTSLAMALGTLPLLAAESAFAQNDSVMNRGMMENGGYAGLWLPALLIVAAIALVAWSIKQRRK
jgi:hypothetical protein